MKKMKRFLRAMLSVFAAAILMGTIPACASRPSEKSGPKFVAHRGYSRNYVDNTEESFRAAAEMDFYGIETDIRKTKDGYFVCTHDAEVEYANRTKAEISSTDRETLLSLPLKNNKTKQDVYLCTFETYLQACKAGGKVAVIELKDLFGKSDIRKILATVDQEYDRAHVSFISFYYLSLLRVKEVDASIELQYLSQTEADPVFESCLSDGISIDVKQNILTEALVETFHEAGLKVNVWTVNENADLRAACALGVDYITTDVFSEN